MSLLFAQPNGYQGIDSLNVVIRNLGDQINSSFIDYAPTVSADGAVLIYTSRRPHLNKNTKHAKDRIYRAVYDTLKKDWLGGIPFSKTINALGQNNSAVYLSNDGQRMLIYRDDINTNGDIYQSRLIGYEWTEPESLGEPINTMDKELSACFSPDEKTIYFISDRKGGYGGLDVWYSKKDTAGRWGEAINLGPPVNTSADEDAIFIHQGGKVLFFSSDGHSDGHGALGGYDIFMSAFSDLTQTWEIPQNIGVPINTPEDDLYFTMEANGRVGYYSTIHFGGWGRKDLYQVIFNEEIIKADLLLLKGRVLDKQGDPIEARIEVTDKSTNEKYNNYYSNSATGKYLIVLPEGKKFELKVITSGFNETNYYIDNLSLTGYKEIVKDFIMDVYKTVDFLAQSIKSNDTLITSILPNFDTRNFNIPADMPSTEKEADNIQTASAQLLSRFTKDSVKTAIQLINEKIENSILPEDQISNKLTADSSVADRHNKITIPIENQVSNQLTTDSILNTHANTRMKDTATTIAQTIQTDKATDTTSQTAQIANTEIAQIINSETLQNKNIVVDYSIKSPDGKELIESKEYMGRMLNNLYDPQSKEAKDYLRKLLDNLYDNKSETKYTDSNVNTNVYGRVIDENGNPVKVQIEIINNDTKQEVGNYTNTISTGTFGIVLPQGNYRLILSKNCYLFKSISVNVPAANIKIDLKDITMEQMLEGKKIVLDNILFDYTKSKLRAQSFFTLEHILKLMKSVESLTIEISGHTDNTSSAEHNQGLSEERAKVVMEYLVARGVDPKKLVYKGYGFTQPVASNKTRQGRQLNRRTELKVLNVDLKSEQIKEITQKKQYITTNNLNETKAVLTKSLPERFKLFDLDNNAQITSAEVVSAIDTCLNQTSVNKLTEVIALADYYLE